MAHSSSGSRLRDARVRLRPRRDRGERSAPSGLAPSATTYARELRTLLTTANIPGPYVLYGARFGGLLVLSYAAHWPNPNELAGVVFSEALTPCPSSCSYDFPPEHAELDGLVGVQLGAPLWSS
jgi:pimeloyl-ACP methyl ester carboxylesterase